MEMGVATFNRRAKSSLSFSCTLQGSVEDRIMEMVRQRKEGGRSQQPSTSAGFTWANLQMNFAAANNDRVSPCM